MAELTFLIDKGHGGMLNGVYLTAPKKMYRHENGELAYEGVVNRQYGNRAIELLNAHNMRVIDITPTVLDVDLDARVDIINTYCREYGKNNCLLLSLHMNAGKGEGFEIWTSPGATRSDKYADLFMEFYQEAFPRHKLRKDVTDGDVDKESPFYILVNSKCPAILPEWLFFDNPKDWAIQKHPKQQEIYAHMIANFCKQVQFNPF